MLTANQRRDHRFCFEFLFLLIKVVIFKRGLAFYRRTFHIPVR